MKLRNAFTLLEMVVVLGIIGTMAAILIGPAFQAIESSRLSAERASLADMRKQITASFQSSDYANANVGVPTQIGNSPVVAQATAFDTTYAATAITSAAANQWVVRLATSIGTPVVLGQPISATSQVQIFTYISNIYEQPRVLIAGPTNEANHQRYLLLSLMAPDTRGLVFPANYSGLFDDLWANNWDDPAAQVPANWTSRLTTAQLSLWNTSYRGRTGANRLVVERIVQPKYQIRLNNTHPSYFARLLAEDGSVSILVNPNAGSSAPSSFLAGRTVTVQRSPTGVAGSWIQAHIFSVNQNQSITIQ